MPTFDYVCDTCGRHAERIVPNAETPVPCPADIIHGPMRRLISAPAFSVKGFNARTGYADPANSAARKDKDR